MKEVAIQVAYLMAAAARVAPTAGGSDLLEIVVVTDEGELGQIVAAMRTYAPNSNNQAYWLRDAASVAKAHALVLIGLAEFNVAGYDCGGCGFSTCEDFKKNRNFKDTGWGYSGPHCIMRMMDMGVAISAAAKAASVLCIDSRVQQQRVGAVARQLGVIDADVAMGIPVGICGKSVFHATHP